MALLALLGHPFFASDGDHAIASRIAEFHDLTYVIPDRARIHVVLKRFGLSIDFFDLMKQRYVDLRFLCDALYMFFNREEPLLGPEKPLSGHFTIGTPNVSLFQQELVCRGLEQSSWHDQFFRINNSSCICVLPRCKFDIFYDGNVVACQKLFRIEEPVLPQDINLAASSTFAKSEIDMGCDLVTFIDTHYEIVTEAFIRKMADPSVVQHYIVQHYIDYAHTMRETKRRRARDDAELFALRKRLR